MWHMYDGFGGGGWGPGYGMGFGFGWIVPLVFLGVLIWIAVTLVRMSRSRPEAPRSGDRAVGILRERYARGEITREEFQEMRRELE